MPKYSVELRALRNMLNEAELVISMTELPENRTARCKELLQASIVLTDDLIRREVVPVAAILGKKGGKQTAKKGAEYFRQLASKRKIRGGGRPRKKSD